MDYIQNHVVHVNVKVGSNLNLVQTSILCSFALVRYIFCVLQNNKQKREKLFFNLLISE